VPRLLSFSLLRYSALIGLMTAALLLGGCQDTSQETLAAPEPIASGDSCHVCGMLITSHPGPKGEAFLGNNAAPLKFCSTAELFTFLKQPENAAQLSHAYVHDVARSAWETPDDSAFIRANEALYVIGHDQRGSMGHTLASFAQREDAEAFMQRHGGNIIVFDDVDLELLARLGR